MAFDAVSVPKVLGVLGGRDLVPGALEAWLGWADFVAAADSGADLCRAAGREPDAIVGDLDSIADPKGLVRDEDQDTSDADKLLAFLERRGFATATLIGVEGDRLDHVLATLFSCARANVVLTLALRGGSARIVGAGRGETLPARGRVSIIPLVRSRVTVTGVHWPLDDAILDPLGLVSLSNQMDANRLSISVAEGVVALFLQSGALPPRLADVAQNESSILNEAR